VSFPEELLSDPMVGARARLRRDCNLAKKLYEEGKYKECCNFVDRMFGHTPGELDREYTKEEAEWCMNQIARGLV
jgi:hypothetical protein